jgi:hypothetical protein
MTRQGTTPHGLLKHAIAFSAAADAVHSSRLDDPLPKFFLWGRTIELALKSFLFTQGRTASELRSKQFGHDLNALLRDAKARRVSDLIGLNAVQIAIVRVLNLDYLSERLEYRKTRALCYLPDVTLIRQLVRRLLRGVEFHLKACQSQ